MTGSVTRALAVVSLLVLGTSVGLLSQAAQHPPFMLGVLNKDGALVPLMRFAAGEWTTPWPEDDQLVPSSVDSIPEAWWPGVSRQPWSAILESGPRVLRLQQPTTYKAGCHKAVALATDYANSPPIGEVGYLGELAVASAGDVILRPVRTLDVNSPRDPAWKAAEQLLFDTLRARGHRSEGLELAFASHIPREAGGDIWHVTAVGQGRRVSLWLLNSSDASVWLEDVATDPDLELVGAVTPFAAIWGLDRLTLLAWEQGNDGGQFVVVTVTEDLPVLGIGAGGGFC